MESKYNSSNDSYTVTFSEEELRELRAVVLGNADPETIKKWDTILCIIYVSC